MNKSELIEKIAAKKKKSRWLVLVALRSVSVQNDQAETRAMARPLP